MQSLKILILEDEIITATDLKVTLEEAGHQITAITKNYQEAMASIKKNPADIAILDVILKKSALDGIAIAKELLEHNWMPIIYLTANSGPEIFMRAKETLPAAYLLKPFRHNELAYQVELAYYYFSQSRAGNRTKDYIPENIFVKIKDIYKKIPKKEILLIQASRVYSIIHLTTKEKAVTVTGNLTYLSQYLPETSFFRLSRSYIINLDHIERFDQNYIYFSNFNEKISIPSGSKAELKKVLNALQNNRS